MNSFSFENQGSVSYLVYKIEESDCIDSMSLGMLTNNKIPGLLPVVYTQMDSTRYIKYNISSKVSVKQFFEGQVNKKRLIGVFNGIVDAMISAEDYMIDVNTIMLDLDYIFADVSTCDSMMVCLPIVSKKNEYDLSSFFKFIMFNTRFDQTENCDHVALILNYLNSTPVFSLTEFKSLLDRIRSDGSSVQQKKTPESYQSSNYTPKPDVSIQPPKQQTADSTLNRSNAPISQHETKVQQTVVSFEKLAPAPITYPAQKSNVQTPLNQQNHTTVSPSAENSTPMPVTTPDGKKPSLMWLMMHYSKENKAIYDASKKSNKSATSSTASQSTSSSGFAVPGKQNSNGFAIPGQQPSVPTPQPTNQNQTQQSVKSDIRISQQTNTQPTPQYQQPLPQQVGSSYTMMPLTGQSVSFGETTVLDSGNIGETTVLGESSGQVIQKPYLIRIKNNERIDINKPFFKIGKEKSYVDYFISDNTAISRSHATIICREGQYFIVDTNSTNHTYVNGGMIQSNVETLISHGTKIRLANEEFEFKLY